MTDLAGFFRAAVPYLKGQSSVFALETALGTSPSGRPRLEFYRRLMQANVRRVMVTQFDDVRRALGADPKRFYDLVDKFDRAHPPSSFDLNSIGAPFPAFLAATAARGEVPPWLPEVADFAWARFALSRAPMPAGSALGAPIDVRTFAFDVPDWTRGDRRAAPSQSPSTVILWRDRGFQIRFQKATRAGLVALAHACGEIDDDTAALVDADLRAQARATLVQQGILLAAEHS